MGDEGTKERREKMGGGVKGLRGGRISKDLSSLLSRIDVSQHVHTTHLLLIQAHVKHIIPAHTICA